MGHSVDLEGANPMAIGKNAEFGEGGLERAGAGEMGGDLTGNGKGAVATQEGAVALGADYRSGAKTQSRLGMQIPA